jgi:hypothetical protein
MQICSTSQRSLFRPLALPRHAIFRQINKEKVAAHHDALEFPDGQIVLLTSLSEGQQATVLQLPAAPRNAALRRKAGKSQFAKDCVVGLRGLEPP